ncbi:hypothetical protein O6H91_11G024200 [Diphasiastrum complanatum]|uniref:Uncharacterized protein n=1 Tax=Diphasiastrum complanatum TaxID=34168 RepID=A0ACC2C7K6_DIPCM|nr:hypothetical protein O6H91_11G024200 [Diphasiastrum complanatum]
MLHLLTLSLNSSKDKSMQYRIVALSIRHQVPRIWIGHCLSFLILQCLMKHDFEIRANFGIQFKIFNDKSQITIKRVILSNMFFTNMILFDVCLNITSHFLFSPYMSTTHH